MVGYKLHDLNYPKIPPLLGVATAAVVVAPAGILLAAAVVFLDEGVVTLAPEFAAIVVVVAAVVVVVVVVVGGVAAPGEVVGIVVVRFYVVIRNIEYSDPFHTPFDGISTYVSSFCDVNNGETYRRDTAQHHHHRHILVENTC
jgi:hypothetical protein